MTEGETEMEGKREEEREKKRGGGDGREERMGKKWREISHPLVHSSEGCVVQCGARPEAGSASRSLRWMLGAQTWTIFHWLSQMLVRKLDQKWCILDKHWYTHGIPVLQACATTPIPMH